MTRQKLSFYSKMRETRMPRKWSSINNSSFLTRPWLLWSILTLCNWSWRTNSSPRSMQKQFRMSSSETKPWLKQSASSCWSILLPKIGPKSPHILMYLKKSCKYRRKSIISRQTCNASALSGSSELLWWTAMLRKTRWESDSTACSITSRVKSLSTELCWHSSLSRWTPCSGFFGGTKADRITMPLLHLNIFSSSSTQMIPSQTTSHLYLQWPTSLQGTRTG